MTKRTRKPPQAGWRPARPAVRMAGTAERAGTVRITTSDDEPREHLFRRLLGAYLSGAEGVEMVETAGLSSASREIVGELARRTRGCRTVLHSSAALRWPPPSESGVETGPTDLVELGRRVAAFHRRVIASRSGLPTRDERSWQDEDDAIDAAAWALRRAMVRGPGLALDPGLAYSAWTMVHALERIGDEAVSLGRIAPWLADLPQESPHRHALRFLHQQTLEHLEAALDSSDGASANMLLDVGEALRTSVEVLTESLVPAVDQGSLTSMEAVAAGAALRAVATTIGCTQEILHTRLDLAQGTGCPRARASDIGALSVG